MPLVKVTFQIDDNEWPKLKLTGERFGPNGERSAFDQKMIYDQAYAQFENTIHNQLRPMVDALVARRKQPRT